MPKTNRQQYTSNLQDFIDHEVQLYCKAIYYECRGEPLIGKLSTLQVIINRQNKYRLTVEEVLSKGFNKNPNFFQNVLNSKMDSSVIPYITILKSNPIHDYLYFYNPKTSTDKRFIRKLNKKNKLKIKRHTFINLK